MAFDLSTATPVSSGFDLSTAVPVTATAVAKDEGMPTRSLSQRLSMAKTGRLPPETNSVGEAAAALGRGALKGTFGAAGDIVGVLSDYSPATLLGITPKGLTEPYIPTGEKVGEMFNLGQTPPQYGGYELISNLIGPSAIAKGAGLATRGVRSAIEAGRNFFNPTANALITATGGKAPEIVNALRAGTPGLETAGAVAAPVGSIEFSQFAKKLEPYAAQTNADITKVKDAVLGGNVASVETAANDAAKTAASDIAAPNQSEVGKDLTGIAKQTREQVKKDIIRPAYDAAFKAAGDAKIDASGVVAKAVDILGDPLADIPRKDMPASARALSKLESAGPNGPKVQATLQQLDGVRKAINSDIAASKIAGNDARLRELGQLHKAIDNAVADSTSLDDMQKSLYKNALDQYRTEYTPRFKTGEAAKIFENRARNTAGINDEDVAAALVKGPTEAKSFAAMIGDNPDALKKAQEGIEGIYRDKVIKDGVIDQTAHDAFMQKYGPQIDILDNAGMNLKDKLNSAVAKTQTALSPINDVAEIRSSINQKPLPAGANADEIASRAQALSSALPPDELEKALQIARRGQEYDRLAMGKTSAASEVPISKPIGFTPLEWSKRVFVETMKKVGSKLSDKLTAQLAEQFTNPHQAADVIEQAIKYRAAQDARKAATTAKVDIFTNTVNKLAPASATVNALTEQRR